MSRRRGDTEHRDRREDEAGIPRRRGNAEHRDRRRDVEKTRRPKSEVSGS